MIQDIKPYFLDNHFDPAKELSADSRIIIIRDNNYLLNEKSLEAGIVEFPHTSDFDTELTDSDFAYIYTIGEDNFFLYISDKHKEFKIPGYAYTQLNVIRGKELSPKHMVYAAFTAFHIHLLRKMRNQK